MALPGFPRRVVLLGSTGSIGQKAVSVAERYPDRIQVVGIAANQSVEELARQAALLGVPQVVVGDPACHDDLVSRLPKGSTAGAGAEAITELAGRDDVDLVVNGIVGRAGLEASLEAARRGKVLAIANKESLVLAGELLMSTARETGATVIPVDSEHSGLFQCLEGRDSEQIDRLIITASGGPFRGRTRADLEDVTPEQALQHPTWPMGPRITVDSSTLFNKGLEVIETHVLFNVPLDRIDVWVHPQSVVHALVQMTDQSLIGQLSAPDMLMPVQYAMSYPERWAAASPACRLPDWGNLDFEMPDRETFPALGLAYQAAERGGTAPTVLNAADEVAVGAFLDNRLPYLEIASLVAEVLDRVPVQPADSLESIIEADRLAREQGREFLEARAR